MIIKFFFNSASIKIPERKKLKQFIFYLFQEEKKILKNLTYIFCTDKYLLSLNKEFLAHDDYTDIITFTLSELSDPIVGEIYISVERVKENAVKFRVGVDKELHRVIFHGALHLCGYKDKTRVSQKIMAKAEDKYLSEYFSK